MSRPHSQSPQSSQSPQPHNFFSSSIQITQDNSRLPFSIDYGYSRQEEVTPDINDVRYLLAENKNIKKIIQDSNPTKLNLFQFYFNIHIPEYNAKNDDIHFNQIIRKILEAYLNDVKIFHKFFQPEHWDDILRVYVERLYSFIPTKHTFCIGIISLKNHKGEWGELKNHLANIDVKIQINGSNLHVKGEYPIDIADLNGVYHVEE